MNARPQWLDALRLGAQMPAGLGRSTCRPDIDFETYSEAGYVWNDATQRWDGPPGAPKQTRGLPLVGTEPYVRHPSFRIVWMAYDLKDGHGPRRWYPGMPPPSDLLVWLRFGGEIEAWSVQFERWVWELYCVPVLGWPPVAEHQWFCAQAKARAFALPGALGKTAEVLNLQIQKDKRGASLLKLLSMPVQPTKADPRRTRTPVYTQEQAQAAAERFFWTELDREPDASERKRQGMWQRAWKKAQEELADTLAYGDYNVTDIEAEAEAAAQIPDLEGPELAWWRTHERINRRGVHIDRAGVENCVVIVLQAFARYNTELQALTGIDSASKIEQLQGWLRGQGVFLDSLDEDAVTEALKNAALPPQARRVLEIRAAVGSASIKKLFAILNRLSSDQRLRDLYVYHGARTGRSTGEGPQPTNLPKAGPNMYRCGRWEGREFVADSGCQKWYGKHRLTCPHCGRLRLGKPREDEWNPEIAEQALEDAGRRSLEWMEHVYGEALPTIAGCLRALFCAAPGHDLISTDYNSIEAVGLAMMAGEQWRIKVFNTHGKIYEASASTMFGVPLDEILAHKKKTDQHHPLRQKGKIGELAFGYQGWVGAALAFDMPGTEDEIKADILRWRAASPAIEWLWGGQQVGKAAAVIRNALTPGYDGEADERLHYLADTRWEQKRDTFYFGVEGMAVLAVLEPRKWHAVTRLDGTDSGIAFAYDDSRARLYCKLPSGRTLVYHSIILSASDRGGYAISYEGWNTNQKNGPVGWIRMNTWGGRLVENINQAVCRDILRQACEILEAHGYPVVLHVYDEIVAEVLEAFGSIEEFERLVTTSVLAVLHWAAGWPIKAPGGYRAKRYRKG